jgi:septal ring factor EnvC (AmiA/AmiB activator)
MGILTTLLILMFTSIMNKFDKVDAKIDTQASSLSSIVARVGVSETKIDTLENSDIEFKEFINETNKNIQQLLIEVSKLTKPLR